MVPFVSTDNSAGYIRIKPRSNGNCIGIHDVSSVGSLLFETVVL
jgi:hypothetical protein